MYRTVEKHLQTFCHRERKKVHFSFLQSILWLFKYSFFFFFYYKFFIPNSMLLISLYYMLQMPDMLNWFGWCTWDAFYTDVTSEGVKEGLERYLLSFFNKSNGTTNFTCNFVVSIASVILLFSSLVVVQNYMVVAL
jgi:hypothetical protein